MILRRKGLIAFGLVIGLGLSYLYYSQVAPTYESEVQILVMQKNSNLPTQGPEGTNDFQRQSMDEDLLSTHVQLFRSPRIVKDAIEQLQLQSVPSIAAIIKEDKDAAEYVIKQLTVTKGGDGRAKDAHVLRATFRGPSPKDCATILDALVVGYQDFLGQTFQDTSAEAMELISQAKLELGEELGKADVAYREFREKSPLLWKGEQSSNVHQERFAEVEKSLAEIRVQRTEVKARLDVIEEALDRDTASEYGDLDVLSLLSSKDVERLSLLLAITRGDSNSEAFLSKQPARTETARTEYQQLLSLLLQEKTLLEDFGPDHPRIQTVRKKIELTQDFLKDSAVGLVHDERALPGPAELLKAHVKLLQNDLSELQKREQELEQFAGKEEAAARSLVTFELRGETMQNELSRKQALYDAVIDRLREINMIKDYGGYLTEVISPVELAREPVSPVLVLTLGLGGVLGVFFGAGLAYVVDIADRTFRTPEEIRHALGLPIMGHLPTLASRNGKVAGRVSENGRPKLDPILISHHRPRSRQAEAIRGLRTALYFSSFGAGHKVIQITSPNPKDGKTTLAANLAVSMAQSDKKVLLVDGDFRRPRVHEIFSVEWKVGLSNVLVDEAELADAVVSKGIKNLWILPCGTRPPNPCELLTLPRFEQFIGLVREQYDLVLIDSPPLLAVSDPAVIAPRVDGVLLTIRVHKNGRPSAVQAREILAGIGAEVLGMVINGMNQDHNYAYYTKRYGSGYGYGYGYYGGKNGYAYGDDQQGHDYFAEEEAEEAVSALGNGPEGS